MGRIAQRLGLQPHTSSIRAASSPDTLPFASPWSTSDLQRIVFEDVFGQHVPENTRTAAMRVPTIARGRNLFVSAISRLPLRQADEAGFTADQSSWLHSTATLSPVHRLAWTVDDLIFYGWSCWSRDAEGNPSTRVNQGDWEMTPDNVLRINGQDTGPDEALLIPGLHEGILSYGADALKDIKLLGRIVRQRLLNPVPGVDLHQTGGPPMTEDEIDKLTARWAKARQAENGGVGYTNEYIEAREMGAGGDAQLMIEARNAASVDMARLIGIHAGMVDATAPKASLNYETQAGRNLEFTDLDLQLYMVPIAARLSMDDVCPSGLRVEFDTSDWTGPQPAPSGPARED